VYDRADQRDRRKMFTKELVDAFDASAAFLYCLESQIFTPYKEQGCDFNEDLRQRAEYAEWRAYDVALALKCGKNPTQVADALDGTSGDGLGGEFPNIGGVSLAAAAPPPLDLPNDVPKQPEERPGCVAQEEKDGEQSKKEKEHQQREQEVKQEEKEDEVKPKEQVQDVKNTKVEEGKKESVKNDDDKDADSVVNSRIETINNANKKSSKKKKKKKESVKNDDDKDADSVVNSRIETEKVSSPSEPPKRQEAPMFNGVTSTRHGNTDWIKIESKKTSQKFWFNERTKEKTWEEPPNE